MWTSKRLGLKVDLEDKDALWQTLDDSGAHVDAGGDVDDERADLRRAYRTFTAYGLAAVGLAVVAGKTRGRVRVVSGILAALLGAVTAWSFLFVGVIDRVVTLARRAQLNDPTEPEQPPE